MLYTHMAPEAILLSMPILCCPGVVGVIGQRLWQSGQRLIRVLRDDWQGSRFITFGLILLVMVSLVVSAYYANHPQVETYYDTATYVAPAKQILTNGKLVDARRTPGYPLLIALVFLLAGQGNLFAVSLVQGVLFILAAGEIYILTALIFRRAWIAFMVGLSVGLNIYLLSFAKPALSEGLALWEIATLALLVVLFLQNLRLRYLWMAAGCTLVLFMTRPEWIYVPIPLFAYLLFVAWRRHNLRRVLPHALIAVVLLYSVLGLYIYANATLNGYAGVTDNQPGNLLGKVLEYHMQNEAPPEYARIMEVANAYVAQGGNDPNVLAVLYPPLRANHWALGGAYAQAIVTHHWLEFMAKTIPVFFGANDFYWYSFISAQGPFASPLVGLQNLSAILYYSYTLFPLFALFWIVLWCRKRTARLPAVEGMGAVIVLVLYALTITSVAGFVDFGRLRAPFDPLVLVVIWGTLLAGLSLYQRLIKQRRVSLRLIWWGWGLLLLSIGLVSIVKSWISGGISGVLNPGTWLVLYEIHVHFLQALVLLGVAVYLTVYLYWAQRQQGKAAGTGDLQKQVDNGTSQGASESHGLTLAQEISTSSEDGQTCS